jgi:hypothetical protein
MHTIENISGGLAFLHLIPSTRPSLKFGGCWGPRFIFPSTCVTDHLMKLSYVSLVFFFPRPFHVLFNPSLIEIA